MKKIFLIAAGLSLGVATTSCSLEKFHETMYAENNNPEAVSDTNTKGTDRSQRIVEFFAT